MVLQSPCLEKGTTPLSLGGLGILDLRLFGSALHVLAVATAYRTN
jgi:hypothetical protein